jgi:hypothetical protein
MLNRIGELITERLVLIPELVSVGDALRDSQPSRPCALVYLYRDERHGNAASRLLTWAVQISVDHSAVMGAAGKEMLSILNQARNLFVLHDWPEAQMFIKTTTVGVSKIEIEDYKDYGPVSYIMFVEMIALPGLFNS